MGMTSSAAVKGFLPNAQVSRFRRSATFAMKLCIFLCWASTASADEPLSPLQIARLNYNALLQEVKDLVSQQVNQKLSIKLKSFLETENRCAHVSEFIGSVQLMFDESAHVSLLERLSHLKNRAHTELQALAAIRAGDEAAKQEDQEDQEEIDSLREKILKLITKLEKIEGDLKDLTTVDGDSSLLLSEFKKIFEEFCLRISSEWGGLGSVEKQLRHTQFLLDKADIEFTTAEEIRKEFEKGLWRAAIRPLFMNRVLDHLSEMETHLYAAKHLLRPFSHMLKTNQMAALALMGEEGFHRYERQLSLINSYFTLSQYDQDAEIASWEIAAETFEETLESAVKVGLTLLAPGTLSLVKIPKCVTLATGLTLTTAYFHAQVQEAGGIEEYFVQLKDDSGVVTNGLSAALNGEEFATLQFFESLTRFYYNARALAYLTSALTRGLLLFKNIEIDIVDILLD
ncbi:MAG: hypothetical protein HY391_02655 [Deltaproteobacteria bacterium]|nr:hypothetical protein [Deltaproteobacteria bacterium]